MWKQWKKRNYSWKIFDNDLDKQFKIGNEAFIRQGLRKNKKEEDGMGVIPCEKSEKKIADFFLDFWVEKSKVLVILGIEINFLTFLGNFWPVYWIL